MVCNFGLRFLAEKTVVFLLVVFLAPMYIRNISYNQGITLLDWLWIFSWIFTSCVSVSISLSFGWRRFIWFIFYFIFYLVTPFALCLCFQPWSPESSSMLKLDVAGTYSSSMSMLESEQSVDPSISLVRSFKTETFILWQLRNFWAVGAGGKRIELYFHSTPIFFKNIRIWQYSNGAWQLINVFGWLFRANRKLYEPMVVNYGCINVKSVTILYKLSSSNLWVLYVLLLCLAGFVFRFILILWDYPIK